MHERKHITVHLLILISLSILTIILFYKFSTEDSYITYRYTQNLIDGEGFVYNPGEEFLGTTAPFYGLILAFFGLSGAYIPFIGGILSAFSLGMSVILIYFLTLRKGYPVVGLFCGLFIFLNPWFLQTFGSETYFQLFMIISAFYFYDQKKYIPTVIFCALAFLVRADGIIPAGIILVDYMIKNKKIPLRGIILFILLCAPVFLFYYFYFNTLFPGTLEAKNAQYTSGLWMKFLPGTFYFAKLIVKENILFYFFIPLLLIGGSLILLSRRIWVLITSWAILHTIGYFILEVPFYHWYSIPLILLLMLMSAFSLNFITSVPRFFEKDQITKWNAKIFNQDVKLSIAKFKDTGPRLKWAYRIISFVIIFFIAATISGGIRAYYHTYKSFPFPKLELYTKAGKWIDENTPLDSSIAALEVGYLGYYARRKVIDLVGLVTPGVSKLIRLRDFQWAVIKYQPDFFIFNAEFQGWLNSIVDQSWFDARYEHVMEISQPGFPFNLTVFKKTSDFKDLPPLITDSYQNESNIDVGEIIEGVEIGQTFYCHHNNLARIKVMLATYARDNHQKVIFHLKKSSADKQDIYTEEFSASSVIDNDYRIFDFLPILDSKGKMFYFCLESPSSQKGDAITIWANSVDKYEKGSLHINRKESHGDLRFITYFYKNENFLNEE